jgi:hypothetical protein
MFFYLGTLCLSLCYFLYALAFFGTRNPKKPLWASEMVMSSFICPMIVALLSFGIAGLLQSLIPGSHPTVIDMTIASAIAIASVALYLIFSLGKKMAAAAQEEVTLGEVIQGNFNGISSDNNNRPSTHSPSKLPKAA